MTNPPARAHVINHIGLNVTDVAAAASWYVDVLGFELVVPPVEIVAEVGEVGRRFAGLAGPSFGRCRIAYLTTLSGLMVELFEFSAPATRAFDNPWTYWRPGLWHVGVTASDLEATVARIEETGGKRQSEYFEVPPGSGYKLVFCLDPWGNALELMNVNCERMITRALPPLPPPVEGGPRLSAISRT